MRDVLDTYVGLSTKKKGDKGDKLMRPTSCTLTTTIFPKFCPACYPNGQVAACILPHRSFSPARNTGKLRRWAWTTTTRSTSRCLIIRLNKPMYLHYLCVGGWRLFGGHGCCV